MHKKILLVEDLTQLITLISALLYMDERICSVSSFSLNGNSFVNQKSLKKEETENKYIIDIHNVTSNESFNKLSDEEILEYNYIILDFSLEDGNSLKIIDKINQLNFKGKIIANSDCPDYNEKLNEKGAIYFKDLGLKGSGKIAEKLIELFEEEKKS